MKYIILILLTIILAASCTQHEFIAAKTQFPNTVIKFNLDTKKIHLYYGVKPEYWGKFDEVVSPTPGQYQFYYKHTKIAEVVNDSLTFLK